jgi:hypothetical protein
MKTLLTASAALFAAGFLFVNQPASAQTPTCEMRAKESVDWVVYSNVRYRRTFDTAIRNGAAPYDALLRATRNNPGGTAAIQACADWTKGYLNALGFRPAR